MPLGVLHLTMIEQFQVQENRVPHAQTHAQDVTIKGPKEGTAVRNPINWIL